MPNLELFIKFKEEQMGVLGLGSLRVDRFCFIKVEAFSDYRLAAKMVVDVVFEQIELEVGVRAYFGGQVNEI